MKCGWGFRVELFPAHYGLWQYLALPGKLSSAWWKPALATNWYSCTGIALLDSRTPQKRCALAFKHAHWQNFKITSKLVPCKTDLFPFRLITYFWYTVLLIVETRCTPKQLFLPLKQKAKFYFHQMCNIENRVYLASFSILNL